MTRLRSIAGGLLALFAIFVVSPLAHAEADPAAIIGKPIPHDMNLSDQTGVAKTFATLKGGKGAILLFTRSLDW
jgi:hypothetical protein